MMTRISRFALGLLALLSASVFSADGARADALSLNDLLGTWCGSTADYVFARDRLTVLFHDGSAPRVLPIRKLDVRESEIKVYWDIKRSDLAEDDIATTFYDFDDARQNMAQMANRSGDMGPRIPFHRGSPACN